MSFPSEEGPEYLVYGRVAELVNQALSEGRSPDVDALVREHPDFEENIRQLVPTLAMLQSLGDRPRDDQGPGPLPSRTLGDFRIGGEIGRGGMGVVYEAEQISLGRRVALKVLPFAAVLDARQIERFKNEARAAARLHHTHIVPVYSVGSERGVHYYAMQLIEGQSLSAAVEELRRLDSGGVTATRQAGSDSTSLTEIATDSSTRSPRYFRAVTELGVQAADALEHAHQQGVVHRDIKPSNLLLDQQSNLWITDFGLAHLESDSNLTRTGDVLGTLAYMSPEQVLGSGLVDHRTDVYSLGTTLYELFTLHKAFDGGDRHDLLRQVTAAEPRPLRRWNESLPLELETITLKAMAKEPAARYGTAQELADDLRRFLDNRPIVARRPTLIERGAKWVRRHKVLVTGAVALLVLSVVALAISMVLIWNEQQKTEAAWAQAGVNLRAEATQRRLAEANLQAALDAVDEMLTQVGDETLAAVPQMERVRRELLEKALKFYQGFLKQRATDPVIRGQVARAYGRVADIDRLLGRSGESEDAYDEAIRRLDAMATAFPDEASWTSDLASAHGNLATLLRTQSRLAEAATHRRRALELREALATASPDSSETQVRLAMDLGNLAVACWDEKKFTEAEATYRRALSILDRVPADDLSRDERRRVAVVYTNLGLLLRDAGRPGEAAEVHRKGIRVKRQVVAAAPLDPSARRSLGLGLHGLAQVLAEVGQPGEAEECYRESVDLQRVLVREFPSTPEYVRELADTLGGLFSMMYTANRLDDAENFQLECVGLRESLVERFPEVPDHRRLLANNQTNLGLLYWATARPEKAEECYRRSLQLLEPLAQELAGLVQAIDDLATCQHNLALLLQSTGDLEEAECVVRDALESRRKTVAEAPQVSRYAEVLARCVRLQASVLEGRERFEEAEDSYLESLDLYAGFAETFSEVPRFRQEWAQTLHQLARLLRKTDRRDEAELAFDEALELCAELRERHLNDGQYTDDLAAISNAWAWLLVGDPDPQERDADRAVDLAEQATELVPRQAAFWNTLGLALYRSGEDDRASEALARSVALGGGNASDWFVLALVRARQDRRDEANLHFDQAMQWMTEHASENEELVRFRDEAQLSLRR